MCVYIVVADLWSIGDLVTKDDTLAIMSQYDAGEIRAVFDSMEKAKKFKTEMEELVKAEVEELGCDPIEYRIEVWELNGSHLYSFSE